jgi:hypothetical protein
MAVSTGNIAYASEYNTLRTAVNRLYADNYAGSISFGNVNQTYGWGGSAVSSISTGTTMSASQMNSLIDRCNIGTNICLLESGLISQISSGATIYASQYNNIEAKTTNLTTNRLVIDPTQQSVNSGGSYLRSGVFSSLLDVTFRWTFSSFDQARYFFNSGGALLIYGSLTGYSTGYPWDGQGIADILTAMGTVSMNYTATTHSGTGGVTTSLGYYDLTTAFQNIFYQTSSGGYAYLGMYVYVDARRSATGDYVELRMRVDPNGAQCDGNLTAYTDCKTLNSPQTSGSASLSITAPSYSLIDPF